MVEAELGRIPDADEAVDWEAYYADPAEAERFVAETGIDVLAIENAIDHLLLSPGIRDLLDTNRDFHGCHATGR